jgi:ribonuclease HI
LENDTVAFYSQIIVLALDKAIAQQDFTLYGLALAWGSLHQGGVNDLVANPDSQYVFEQVSWELKGVRVDDRQADLTLQRWALFAEGPDRYYIVEVQYVPAAGQSMQVWDDLQAYLDAFRVIQ